MNKKILYATSLIVILVFILFPIFVSISHNSVSKNLAFAQDESSDTGPSPAETGNGGDNNGGGGTPDVIKTIVDNAVKTAFYIAGGVVVILWIATGILFLTVQGDPGRLKSARNALFAAVAGTALCIIAGGAVSLVSSAFGL